MAKKRQTKTEKGNHEQKQKENKKGNKKERAPPHPKPYKSKENNKTNQIGQKYRETSILAHVQLYQYTTTEPTKPIKLEKHNNNTLTPHNQPFVTKHATQHPNQNSPSASWTTTHYVW